MDYLEIEAAVERLGDWAEDFQPYAVFLRDWHDKVRDSGRRWGEWPPCDEATERLIDLVRKAVHNSVFTGIMPTHSAFKASMEPIRRLAAEYGLQVPTLGNGCGVAYPDPARSPAAFVQGPPSGHEDMLWTVTIRDFVGDVSFVGDLHEFDGRADGSESEEDYSYVWEWDDFGRTMWSGVRDGAEYTVVELSDFDPPTVVLRTNGKSVGFYMDAMCWIDPEHRGKGLSVDLIRGGIALLGEVPNLNLVGFSQAGLSAHEAAHRESVREAILRGDLGDDHIPYGP